MNSPETTVDELGRTSAAQLVTAATARTDIEAGRADLRRTVRARRRVRSVVSSVVLVAVVAAAVAVAVGTSHHPVAPASPGRTGQIIVNDFNGVVAVDAATGRSERLRCSGHVMAVSPDGTQVAVVHETDLNAGYVPPWNLDICNVRTGAVTTPVHVYPPLAIRWTSNSITVASFTDSQPVRLIVDQVRGSATTRRTYPAPGNALGFMSWNPDGTRLADAIGIGLYVVDIDASTTDHLEMHRTGESGGPIAWSPDGNRIAFITWAPITAQATEPEAHVGVINVDGSARTDLGTTGIRDSTRGEKSVTALAWSPDSTAIAYISKGGDVVVRDLNGGQRQIYTDTAANGLFWTGSP